MQTRQRFMLAAVHREAGFTLVEVLVAVGLLTVGILGIGLALSTSSGIASGDSAGLAAVSRSNSYSTATELAQDRLEQMKNATYNTATDQITAANFPNEAYGSIAGYSGFRRTVSIVPDVPDPNSKTKTLTVQVFFTPQYGTRIGSEESVQVVTLIARRP